jgi:hypothetical protein
MDHDHRRRKNAEGILKTVKNIIEKKLIVGMCGD